MAQNVGVSRIVIIEDHEDTGELMREILALAGHTVEVAHTGRAGIEAALRLPAEIVFCDVGLPDLDGHEVARALRREPATARARLIALTGFDGPDDRARAIAAGFDVHVTKPIDPFKLDALAR
jgi:CheY-like chemotaxis protein